MNQECITVLEDVPPATLEVWAGPLSDGSVAAILLNTGSSSASITAEWSDIGIPAGAATVRDLWQHKDMGSFTGSYSAEVASHGVVMVTVTPA